MHALDFIDVHKIRKIYGTSMDKNMENIRLQIFHIIAIYISIFIPQISTITHIFHICSICIPQISTNTHMFHIFVHIISIDFPHFWLYLNMGERPTDVIYNLLLLERVDGQRDRTLLQLCCTPMMQDAQLP